MGTSVPVSPAERSLARKRTVLATSASLTIRRSAVSSANRRNALSTDDPPPRAGLNSRKEGFRCYRTGANRVDADAVTAEIERRGTDNTEYRVLSRRIQALTRMSSR